MDISMISYQYNKQQNNKKQKNQIIRQYWLSISRRGKNLRENFCERCERSIGKYYTYQELLNYKGHKICLDCFEDKQRGVRLPIDIEDYTKEIKKEPTRYIPVAER